MRNLTFISVLSILLFSCTSKEDTSAKTDIETSKATNLPTYIPANQTLYDTIVALDNFLWDAYNNQNDSIFSAYATQDFEFYHDQGGVLMSKENYVKQVRKFFKQAGEPGVIGETVKGTNEVYEIPDYGAVQLSYQRFRDNENPKWTEPARRITIWKKTQEGWLQSKSISLHAAASENE